jgi:hypothetical protein
MKFASRRVLTTLAVLVAFPASLATLGGCASTEGVAQEAVYQTPNGVAIVDTLTTVATVTAIDAATRKVTMTTPDGKSSTYKAASGIDLSQFQVGQQIGVEVMDETALSIKNNGTPARDAVATSFATEADGGAGAVFESEAVEVSAKVIAIDAKAHTVTLQLADGKTKTMKAHGSVDLSGLAVGSTVVVKYAVAVVVAVANA